MKRKPENNSDLNGIRTYRLHDLCYTDAEFDHLSYQPNWEPVIL